MTAGQQPSPSALSAPARHTHRISGAVEEQAVPALEEILSADPDEFVARYTDIAAVNLACAAGLPKTERLDIPKCLRSLDAMALWIRHKTASSWHIYDQDPAFFDRSKNLFRVILMLRFLNVQFGVHYNPLRKDPSEENYDPSDSADHFLHGILGPHRMGTCATLPVFAVAVGRRLGYPLKLVKVPDHLFFRWEDGSERFNVEYNGESGETYPDEHYYNWPVKWTPEIHRARKYALWLESCTPREDAAQFLGLRVLVLESRHRFVDALICLNAAERFNPMAAPLYQGTRIDLLQKIANTFNAVNVPRTRRQTPTAQCPADSVLNTSVFTTIVGPGNGGSP